MEGLRFRVSKYKNIRPWYFSNVPSNTAYVYQVWPRVDGLGAVDNFYVESIEDTSIVDFLERGIVAVSPCEPAPAFSSAGVKVVFSSTDWRSNQLRREYGSHIEIPQAIFEDILHTLSPDPLSISIFRGFYPIFEYSGGLVDGDIAAVHFRTPGTRFMWSIRQHEKSPTFDTRCIAIVEHGHHPIPLGTAFNERSSLLGCLEAFKQDVHSPLYFPFVISVQAFITCHHLFDFRVEFILSTAERSYNSTSGYLGEHEKNFLMSQDSSRGLLERALLVISTTLDSIESLNQYLEDMAKELPPSAKSGRALQSTNSILSAIQFQRRAIKSLREGVRLAERRARNEASLRADYLSSQDSKMNTETAVASRDLAAAARRDSSAMKSIAVLTMAFLPGTFFAALFSMPSLGWDQPRHFGLYWAYTIPFTALTFVIWAIFNQRNELRRWARYNCPFLPTRYLIPRQKRKPVDWPWKMTYDLLQYQRKITREQLRARIDRWNPWKRDEKDEVLA